MPELDLSSMDTDQPVEINLQALEETVPLDKV